MHLSSFTLHSVKMLPTSTTIENPNFSGKVHLIFIVKFTASNANIMIYKANNEDKEWQSFAASNKFDGLL